MNTFNDRAVTISFYRCLAFCLGAVGVLVAFIGAGLYLAGHHRVGDAATILTIPLVGGAAVLRIRAFFATLHERWYTAFEMGRQVGRQEEREEHDGVVMPFR